jgi:transposase-like protein
LRALFIESVNARKASDQTGMHFATVQKHYEVFRKELALKSDEQYQLNSHRVTEYDEYLYLPKSLKAEENIDKFQHFLTLSYDNKVYNLMMPDIKRYRIDTEDGQKRSLLIKYLSFSKVAKLSKAQSIITEFWDYFEKFILQYRGVSNEQFIFYLKEAEWRFNNLKQPAPEQSLHH